MSPILSNDSIASIDRPILGEVEATAICPFFILPKKRISPFALRIIVCLLVAFAITPFIHAQNTNSASDTGIHHFETYDGARETVSLGTGNVFVAIPLLALSGRSGMNYSVALIVNSQSWSFYPQVQNSNVGMAVTRTGAVYFHPSGSVLLSDGDTRCITGYTFTDENGGAHSFSGLQTGCYSQSSCRNPSGCSAVTNYDYLSGCDDRAEGICANLNPSQGSNDHTHCRITKLDGSWFPLANCSGVTSMGGAAYITTPATMEDPNGNEITVNSTGGANGGSGGVGGGGDSLPNGIDTDTLGRTVTYSSANHTLQYRDSSGTTRTMTFNVSPLSLSCSYLVGSTRYTYSHTVNVISSVVLPNSLTYIFQYDNCGLPIKIVYPSGGYTRYQYADFTKTLPAPVGTTSNYEVTAKYVCRTTAISPGSTSTAPGNNCSVGEDETAYTPSINGSTMCSNFGMNVTDPLGNLTTYQFGNYQSWMCPMASSVETNRQIFQGVSTPLRTVSTTYTTGSGSLGSQLYYYPKTVTTILPNNYQSQVQYDYYALYLPSEKREYDWGLGAPATSPTRRTDYSSYCNDKKGSEIVYDGSGNQVAKTIYEFDNYTEGISSSGATQHDSNYGTSFGARCNLTATEHWRKSDGAMLITRMQYSDAGNVVKSTDQCGNSSCSDMTGTTHSTTFSYADTWDNSVCAPAGGNAAAYPTVITDALGHTTKYWYNSCRGTIGHTLDQNNQPTYFGYDSMDRPTSTTFADGGQSSTCFSEMSGSTCYSSSYPLKVVQTQTISSGINKITTSLLDGLARPTQMQLNTDPDCAASDGVKTDATYDALERKATVSNPYCTIGDSTYGVTTYVYDALNRTTRVTHPDGTYVSTSYTGRATDVQDEGNGTRSAERVSQVDGLGRLVSVCEVTSSPQLGAGGSPAACGQDINKTGFLTTYTYDTLSNLLSVNQGSLLARTFAYDSLSHLLCAANPESGGSATCPNPDNGTYTAGTTRYAYDANGNLMSRVRPAPNQGSLSTTVTTSYQYDNLNRLTQTSYSDGTTPPVSLGYDIATVTMGTQQLTLSNPIGRRVWTCVQQGGGCPSMTATSYDAVGRLSSIWQASPVSNNNLWASYTYDFFGDEISRNMSGNQYASTYNTAGRITSFVATSWINSTNPANILTNVHYDAFGHLVSGTFTNGLAESLSYDTRGRVTKMAVGTNCSGGTCSSTQYGYSIVNPSNGLSGYAPNNDILFANDTANGNWSYSYDDFNRILTSNKNSGQQAFSYDYDRYGNRWHQNGPLQMLLSFNGNNNRVDGYLYDAVGNLLNDGNHSYTYDADGHTISVDGATAYTYDADGERVTKTNAGLTTEYLYDGRGQVFLYAYSHGTSLAGLPQKEVNVAGIHLGSYTINSTVTDSVFAYDHSDWLGTERAHTNLAGTACETISSFPFGDGQSISGSCSGAADVTHRHFTSKERDNETGMDYFGARYYGSNVARFVSADNVLNDSTTRDPQSWNLYTYVRNNPLGYVDPTGEMVFVGQLGCYERKLVERLEATYGCHGCVSVNSAGFLQVDTSNLSKKVIAATQFLTDAINSTTQFWNVQVSNDDPDVAFGHTIPHASSVEWNGRRINASLIVLDFGDDYWVSGDDDAKKVFLDTVFAHEIAHQSDPPEHDPTEGRETGPVVDRVNGITDALGLPHRTAYMSSPRGGYWTSLPFTKTIVDKKGQPKEKSVEIKWVKRTVGGEGVN